MKTQHVILLIVISTMSWTSLASANSTDNDVAVVLNGGVQVIPIYGLRTSPDGLQASHRGNLTLFNTEPTELISVSDLKILPYNMHLIADANGRDVLITDDRGFYIRSLRDNTGVSSIASASVVSYGADAIPRQVLLTNTSQSLVYIYDLREKRYLWSAIFALPGFVGELTQAIYLPDNRIAVAVNWPSLDLFAIDIIELDNLVAENTVRLANRSHSDAPLNTVEVPQIESAIRDIIALDTGELLITTRYHLLVVTFEGDIVRRVAIDELPTGSGEFVSARPLPSGLMAVATMQPGMWNQSHTNHRVYWYDPLTNAWVATSPPLSRAPHRVEPLQGHGGTGSQGFEAEFEFNPDTSPDELVLEPALSFDQNSYRPGDTLSAKATLINDNETAAWLAALHLYAAAGNCEQAQPIELNQSVLLHTNADIFIEPQTQYEYISSLSIELQQLDTGSWCGFIVGETRQGDIHTWSDMVDFKVIARQNTSDSTIYTRDIGRYDEIIANPSVDDETPEPPTVEILEQDASCACQMTTLDPARHLVVYLSFALVFVAFRVRRSRAGTR